VSRPFKGRDIQPEVLPTTNARSSSSLHDLKPTLALDPVRDDEDAALDLLTRTSELAAIAHVKKIAELAGAGRVHRLNEYTGFG
jgi:hypothetical protein